MIDMIRMGQPETFSEPRARCRRFGPGPRITISASGAHQAAPKGLTRVRTRSHVQGSEIPCQRGRHPQENVGSQTLSLRQRPPTFISPDWITPKRPGNWAQLRVGSVAASVSRASIRPDAALYRYYVSAPLQQGKRRPPHNEAIRRVWRRRVRRGSDQGQMA